MEVDPTQDPTPSPSEPVRSAEPPRGTFDVSVDEKGRLKLPVNFQQYLNSMGDNRVFVTSLDSRIARIYPIPVWKENEKVLFDQASEDPDVAEDVSFIVNHYGGDSSIDSQGRVTLPTTLRRKLGLENKTVWIDVSQGAVNVYNEEIYEERQRRAETGLSDKVKNMKRKGLK